METREEKKRRGRIRGFLYGKNAMPSSMQQWPKRERKWRDEIPR